MNTDIPGLHMVADASLAFLAMLAATYLRFGPLSVDSLWLHALLWPALLVVCLLLFGGYGMGPLHPQRATSDDVALRIVAALVVDYFAMTALPLPLSRSVTMSALILSAFAMSATRKVFAGARIRKP